MIGVSQLKIVYLGWGSLIWDPRNLKIKSEWYYDGPLLPVEFARISRNGRLTLVLYQYAEKLPVLWAYSHYNERSQAIENLRSREETNESRIGFLSISDNKKNCKTILSVLENIRNWAIEKEIDSVIWTDLSSNFGEKTKKPFNTDNIIKYLQELPVHKKQIAREYIEKAPLQIMTPIRKEIEKTLSWKHGIKQNSY